VWRTVGDGAPGEILVARLSRIRDLKPPEREVDTGSRKPDTE
jgi:hypothetical protein